MLMSDRRVGLIIDRHQYGKTAVVTGVPQRSPVSPIIFVIYLSGVYKEVKKRVEGYRTTSFADNCR